jgi:hypothetical protein
MTAALGSATLCPSAPAASGATLIGVVAPDGRVAQLGTALTIDDAFLETAKAHGPPEQRFRFAAPCQERNCINWSGSACRLIGELHRSVSAADLLMSVKPIPRCPIRSHCRWWQQRGAEACAVCSLVVTDSRTKTRKALRPPRKGDGTVGG